LVDKLFNWSDWDGDFPYLMFYECEILVDFFCVAKGTKVDCIKVDFEAGKMSFTRKNATAAYAEFNLALTVESIE
jgi:hypothetical protein